MLRTGGDNLWRQLPCSSLLSSKVEAAMHRSLSNPASNFASRAKPARCQVLRVTCFIRCMPLKIALLMPRLLPLPRPGMSFRTLRRFLPEVFPRSHATGGRKDRTSAQNNGSRTRSADAPRSRYGSTFRRLYGHAAYAIVAFLTRMCGGALKGPPIRDLVEACFEGIACQPATSYKGSNSRERGGGAGAGNATSSSGSRSRGEPHHELTELAVIHAPDLLQGFSEVCSEIGESLMLL